MRLTHRFGSRKQLTLLFSALILGLLVPSASTAAPIEAPIPDLTPVSKLIQQLQSPKFKVRQKAKRALIQRGAEAIAPLKQTALESSAEVAQQAVAILKRLHRSQDIPTIDAAELALVELSKADDPLLAQSAGDALKKNYKISQDRAIDEIRKLGGSIGYVQQTRADILLRGMQPDAAQVYLQLQPNERIEHIVLGGTYKGGDDGLAHVKRLQYLPRAYIIDGCGVSEKGKAQLQIAMPFLEIQNRQKAFLGVSMTADFEGLGCRIMTVTPGSAAANAKLQPGDIISTFDGHRTPDPQTLIDLIAKYKPGQTVKVEYYRARRLTPLNVKLTEWK